VTPAIAALARRLSAGLPDARSRTLALADWVRNNIRYVGVYIGPGGVVPHDAATVLANRYGDCKDHASLLGALLKAAGIASSGVLINGASAYRLPQVATLGIFTHMITYVPGLDLYIDSTADSIAAGYLPDDDLDKPVLLTATGQLARTPPSQKQRDRYALRFDIGANGSSTFSVAKISAGAVAEPYRQAVRDTKQADRDQFVERMLQGVGQRGHGVLDPGRLDDHGDEYTMAFAGVSENFANLPGPTGVATAFNFWGGIIDAVSVFTQEKTRRQAFVCHGIDSEDESDLRFDAALRIVAVPKPLVLHGAGFDYTADYAREGNTVTVRRRIAFHPGGAVCTPDDFERMRPFVDRVMSDLKSQIMIEAL
jgi:hypothetical protein